MNGLSLIGIAVSLFAVGSGLVATGFGVPALVWYPVAATIGIITTTIVLYVKSGKLRELWPDNKTARWLLIGIGLCVAINNGLFFTALQMTTVPVALLTHYLAPLFLAVIFAPWLLGEKATGREVVLTVIGLAGLAAVLWPDLSQAHLNLGAVFGALSAIFFALSMVLNRRLYLHKVSPLSPAVWQNIVPVIAMAPFMFWFVAHGAHFVVSDWWRAGYMGVAAVGLGFSIILIGLERVKKANHAGIMSYGEPIGAIILAAIFMGEPMTAYVVVGAILIIGSGVALVLGKE